MQGLWNMLVMVQDMCSPWWGMITTINSVYSSLGREDGGGSSVHGSELIPFWFPWPPAAAAFFEWTLLCPSAKSGWEWTAEASSTEGHLSLQTPANTGVSSSSLQGCQFGWWAPTQEAEMFIWFLAHSQIPQGLTFIMEEVKQRHNTFTVIPKSCLGVKNSWFWQGQEDFWVCCCWFRGSVFLISVFFLFPFPILIKWTKTLEVFPLFRGPDCPKGTTIPRLRAVGSAFLCYCSKTALTWRLSLCLQCQSCHRGAPLHSAACITLGK